MKKSKIIICLCFISIIPIIISLILTPWFSFEMSLIIYILTPVYIILMLIAFKYVRKEIIYHHHRIGKVTGRTVLIIGGIIPIAVLLLGPFYNILYTGLDFTVFIFWGVSSIIDIIAAIMYTPPKE